MSKPDGGNCSAFPSSSGDGSDGISSREYVCIQLRVPETGEPWLDELIRKSLRDWFAGQAGKEAIELLSRYYDKVDWITVSTLDNAICTLAQTKLKIADAMLELRKP